ncbi:MAG: hypothetical protein ACKV2Q_01560 [Planctomycetaceae bacterium]
MPTRTGEASRSARAWNGGRARHSGCANPPVSGETCRSISALPSSRWQACQLPGTMNGAG